MDFKFKRGRKMEKRKKLIANETFAYYIIYNLYHL